MQHKKAEYFAAIESFIDRYRELEGTSPSTYEIAEGVGLSQSTVAKYLKTMREQGVVSYAGHRSVATSASRAEAEMFCRAPLLGRVSCGIPKLAEENIEEYVRLPIPIFGRGDFFVLRANGDSMTGAGIDDGDLIVVRRQNTADYNDIAVALVDDDATLKRFRPMEDGIHLHAENPAYDDVVVDTCIVQGVAVKVIKELA